METKINNPWNKWAEEKMKNFLDAEGKPFPAGVRHMLAYYGRGDGHCGDCKFFKSIQSPQVNKDNRYPFVYRCVRYSDLKTKWVGMYPACGLFKTEGDNNDTSQIQ